MFPHNKVEIYRGSNLLFTFTDTATDVRVKNVLNGVGNFGVGLGDSYDSRLVAKEDIVKVYLSYSSTFSSTPNFKGKIYQVQSSTSKDGVVRILTGKCNGEILQRKLKHAIQWISEDASVIATALATDLSLGTSLIETETKEETIAVETETYLDLLTRVSDYWVDSGNQVKKDFTVDVSDNLVWKDRPFRSLGTQEILSTAAFHTVVWRSLEEKNNIRVLGDNSKRYPAAASGDALADTTTDWSFINGDTFSAETTLRKEGAASVKAVRNIGTGDNELVFYRAIPQTAVSIGKDRFKRINFWWAQNLALLAGFHFLCPDNSNYAGCFLNSGAAAASPVNTLIQFSRTFRVPSDFDFIVGTPDYSNCQGIAFSNFAALDSELIMYIDDLYLDDCCYSGTASSGDEDKDLEVTDSQLTSDADCTSRAETILYQQATTPNRIDVSILGNLNVQIGDRVPVTVSSENISAASYDVLSVEHVLTKNPLGFTTNLSMVAAGDARSLSPMTIHEAALKSFANLRQVSKGVQSVGYR